MVNIWHSQTVEQVREHFGAGELGLSAAEVEKNKQLYGSNVLIEAKPDPLWLIFLRQFQSPLIYILMAASVVIYLMDDLTDALIILFVLLFNSVVGTIQEGKAQNTLASLKHFADTKAVVWRSGIEEVVPDTEVVAGDVLILREGDKVPADARITEVSGLTVDEAALTGESQPVYKTNETLEKSDLPTAEQKNMVFKGTNILAGSGQAVAVKVGSQTIIGTISQKIAGIHTEDPLQRDVRKLSRVIIVVAIAICATLFLIGLAKGNSLQSMFTIAVSLAVSIIPEGLPVVLTLVLATGVWRMSKRNALVKKLQAVESLGQAQVIAVDKTGTITKNELVVQEVHVDGRTFIVEGNGYQPTGQIYVNDQVISPVDDPGLLRLAKAAALSANAQAMFVEQKQLWQVSGDPTEAAMAVFAEKVGLRKDELESQSPKLGEIPFSYQTKYHGVLHKAGNGSVLTVVGAPEVVLSLCTAEWAEVRHTPLSVHRIKEVNQQIEQMSGRGLRTVAVAMLNLSGHSLGSERVSGLAFLGLVGMKDELRSEATEALARAREAGMKVVMITGDHKLTAEAIAKEAGIFTAGSMVLTGAEIEKMSDQELSGTLGKVSVFARVTPEHKLRIIQGYRSRGEIIAMTGDGVNDAPPLVAADLGVAMGKIGTEVAKEAADIVLLDDNFGSIVSAVEEGRSIYKTIKKVTLYLFSTGAGEVLAIMVALLVGLPLPVLAAQIIWLNFVTDGFLDVSLAMEPKEKGLLQSTWHKGSTALVDWAMGRRMVVMAIPMAIGTLLLFSHHLDSGLIKAGTMAMTVLAVFQWFNAWNCRSDKLSVFQINPLSNKFLIAATIIVVSLQILAVYHPFLQRILHTTPLTGAEWLVIIAVASSIIWVEELRKLFARRMLST